MAPRNVMPSLFIICTSDEGGAQFLSPQSVFKGELEKWLTSSKGYGLLNYLELLLSSVIISAISK